MVRGLGVTGGGDRLEGTRGDESDTGGRGLGVTGGGTGWRGAASEGPWPEYAHPSMKQARHHRGQRGRAGETGRGD